MRGEITELIADIPRPILDNTDFKQRKDLGDARAWFLSLLIDHDDSTPEMMQFFQNNTVRRRKHFAEKFGVDLDLTDEQWWEL